MARRTSPPIYPHDLPTLYAQQLRGRRTAAGLSMDALAAAMGYTGTWIWQVETGAERPSFKFAEDCDTYWNTDRLFRDIQEAMERPGPVRTVPGFAEYSQHEVRAALIRSYEALMIAGILQTEDFIRAIYTSEQRTAAEIETRVVQRMERQARVLGRDDPPRLWIVHEERALRAMVAPPDVMRAQWAYLLEMCQRPKVHIQVVPENIGYHEGLAGSFTTLTGPSDAAYIESGGYGSYIQDPQAVASFSERFELVRNVALTTSASIDLITSLMESSYDDRLNARQVAQVVPQQR
ncbi:hypothetical protein BTM25_36300 [Actinomadura rubteroloni]|uniref:DUF5753 domain-containing protein n=1 Tax=Actinomadura rubteroloni TaxID=1926885 RepID=A0A2P4UIU8_9ACTN|nr:helix-turn-helix transcriptional regulator [Actinomadura rubteroloni]POM24989.1 hypothetical protein BTM25_36300 [Actinomadura rubteroloni]